MSTWPFALILAANPLTTTHAAPWCTPHRHAHHVVLVCSVARHP